MTTIDCPVNLRKDSIRLLGDKEKSNPSILCNLDIQIESLLKVSLVRRGKAVFCKTIRINQQGIGVSVLVDLAPTETETSGNYSAAADS